MLKAFGEQAKMQPGSKPCTWQTMHAPNQGPASLLQVQSSQA